MAFMSQLLRPGHPEVARGDFSSTTVANSPLGSTISSPRRARLSRRPSSVCLPRRPTTVSSAFAAHSRFVPDPLPRLSIIKSLINIAIAVLHFPHSPSPQRADQAPRGRFSLSEFHRPRNPTPYWPIPLQGFVTYGPRP